MTNILVVLAVVVVAQSCQPPPARSVLSSGHRAIIRTETLTPVLRVGDLPVTVREALRSLFDESSLQMADPQAPPRNSLNPWKRSRRLLVAGCGPDHCLLHYEVSGYPHAFRLAVFGLNLDNAQLEWAGAARRRLGGLAEVKSAVLRSAAPT